MPLGDTVETIVEYLELDVPAADAWELLSDFERLDRWLPGVRVVSAGPNRDGSVRRELEIAGGRYVEVLLERSGSARRLSYLLLSGPLPVQDYCATITVEEVGRNASCATWSAEFRALPADAVGIASGVRRGLAGALRALKRRLDATGSGPRR